MPLLTITVKVAESILAAGWTYGPSNNEEEEGKILHKRRSTTLFIRVAKRKSKKVHLETVIGLFPVERIFLDQLHENRDTFAFPEGISSCSSGLVLLSVSLWGIVLSHISLWEETLRVELS